MCCGVCLGMLLGTMQEDGQMLVVPTVKARATDFSIAAIMARGPRGERRTTCGAAAVAAVAAAAHHSIGLPTLGKCAKSRWDCCKMLASSLTCHVFHCFAVRGIFNWIRSIVYVKLDQGHKSVAFVMVTFFFLRYVQIQE